MSAPERLVFPDLQSQFDSRDIHIDGVGIKGVRYPLTISAHGEPVATIATLSLTVGLSASAKGRHMSRFIGLPEAQTEAGNFESIHNHSAFARVLRPGDDDARGARPAQGRRNLRRLPAAGAA